MPFSLPRERECKGGLIVEGSAVRPRLFSANSAGLSAAGERHAFLSSCFFEPGSNTRVATVEIGLADSIPGGNCEEER